MFSKAMGTKLHTNKEHKMENTRNDSQLTTYNHNIKSERAD